jgi:hypothetical protein
MQLATIQAEKGTGNSLTFDEILMYGGGDEPLEGDWDDQEDEDFDDILEDKEDLHEIQVDDDRGEPDPEDDDHLPDDDLQ